MSAELWVSIFIKFAFVKIIGILFEIRKNWFECQKNDLNDHHVIYSEPDI